MIRLPLRSTLFPYTTLFRSHSLRTSAQSLRTQPPEQAPACTQPNPAATPAACSGGCVRSEEHTSELQSHVKIVCRLLLEKKKVVERARPVGVRAAAHRSRRR